MKKTFIILVLILSFGFVLNVDAKDITYINKKTFNYEYYTDFFTMNDKYYFFHRYDPGTLYNLISYNNDFSLSGEFNNISFNSIVEFDDYYFIGTYGDILKYSKDGTLLSNRRLTAASNIGTFVTEIDDNKLLAFDCYNSRSPRCSFVYLDHDLSIISSTPESEYSFGRADFFGGYNNKSVAVMSERLYFLNENLKPLNPIDVDENNEYDFILSDAKVFGEDGLFLVYKVVDKVDNNVYVFNYDLNGNLKWKKVYETSVKNLNDKISSITKTDEGTYIVTNGSFIEIDKNGKVLNSCLKCLFSKVEKVGDKFYGLSLDFERLLFENFTYDRNTVFSEFKFVEEGKLTIKESENGRVRVNRSNPHVGEEVIITLRPQNGYEYGDIKLLDKDGKKIEYKKLTDKKYSFIMPSGESTLEVLFKKIDKKN
jgi:hypothetical protein